VIKKALLPKAKEHGEFTTVFLVHSGHANNHGKSVGATGHRFYYLVVLVSATRQVTL
jgi:hypothetical protein